MSAALEFRSVDILFCAESRRRARAAAVAAALALLDAGNTRKDAAAVSAACGMSGAFKAPGARMQVARAAAGA
jgi:hypothetical protein